LNHHTSPEFWEAFEILRSAAFKKIMRILPRRRTRASIAPLSVRALAIMLASSVAVFSCTISQRKSSYSAGKSLAGAVHVYVWHETGQGHEPIPGARVFVTTKDGREAASALTDASGEAQFPNSIDGPDSKYLFAEVEGFYLCGLPWEPGSREYDLPLRVQMLVNRITVPAPKR
jgi:hypothetical protein